MFDFRRTSSHVKRAALLAVVITILAHLPPLYLVQHIDAAVLDGYAGAMPGAGPELVVVNLTRLDAMPALTDGTRATVLGPNLLALGPIRSALWADTLPWLLALAPIAALLFASRHRRMLAWGTALGGPPGLLVLSAGTLSGAGVWIPVAGPALLLLATGLLTLQRPRQLQFGRRARLPEPASALALLRQGRLEDAWLAYAELPTTPSSLPELYELGTGLEAKGYAHLAADAYLRIAQVDVDYEDVAVRLVSAARPGGFSTDESRSRLRAEMPRTLGRYRLLEPIGQGTMGRVYLARDATLRRLLAIKLIDMSLAPDESVEPEPMDTKERFLREAETTGRLSHPDIVTVYDVGESLGQAYIAMEFLKGELLSDFTHRDALLPARLTLELGARIADALDYAHGQNVIHRDIKPANIMYDSISGDLKITDFGIARLIDVDRTRTGVVLGTPSFMSPEQIEGGNVKGHTDLFALGVSLYELLTGQLPFRGNSMTKLMFVIANEPHEPVTALRPDLPTELDSVIDTALQKDPAARFHRGAEMADALRAVSGQMR